MVDTRRPAADCGRHEERNPSLAAAVIKEVILPANVTTVSESKVDKFKREDPHGFGMALMAMGIVFFCLVLLWITFTLFGMLMRHMDTAKKVAKK